MAAEFAVVLLNLGDGAKGTDRLFDEGVGIIVFIDAQAGRQQVVDPVVFVRPAECRGVESGRLFCPAFQNGVPNVLVFAAVLANIDTGEVKPEYPDVQDKPVQFFPEKHVVIVEQYQSGIQQVVEQFGTRWIGIGTGVVQGVVNFLFHLCDLILRLAERQPAFELADIGIVAAQNSLAHADGHGEGGFGGDEGVAVPVAARPEAER